VHGSGDGGIDVAATGPGTGRQVAGEQGGGAGGEQLASHVDQLRLRGEVRPQPDPPATMIASGIPPDADRVETKGIGGRRSG
jgi:hypothetical protein